MLISELFEESRGPDKNREFGFQDKGNAAKAKRALLAANIEFTTSSAGGIYYFHFPTAKTGKEALKIVKPLVDKSKEEEWGSVKESFQINEGMRLHPSKPPKGKKIVIVYDATDGGPLDDEMPREWKEFGNLFDEKEKLSPEAIKAAHDARDVKKGEEHADEKALQHLTVWTLGDVSESDIINYVNKKLTASGTIEDMWYG